jgi:hypothetical protein
MADPQGGNVFKDLEIDIADWVTDPDGAKKLYTAVREAADKLEKILDSDTSTSTIEVAARQEYRTNPDIKAQYKESYGELLEGIYQSAEDIPLPILIGLIDGVEKLVSDLKNTLRERSKFEAIHMTDSINDKKLAQIQHKRLREAWDTYRKFIKLFFGDEYPGIKAKPGNYAASITDTIHYQIVGENNDGYYNPYTVAKLLGFHHNNITFMDIMEYCEAHPEQVVITKVRL